MIDVRTRRLSSRLSSAVLSVGVLSAGLAAPALAEDAPRWSSEHGAMSGYFFNVPADDATQAMFQTYFGYDPSDLTLTVAPSDETGAPTGEAVSVPFTAIDPIDGGVVDVLQTRRALGEAGTGPVVYRVSAGDTVLEMAMVLGPDADLSDQQGGKVLALVNPQDSSVSDLPLTWTSQAQMAPGVSAMAFGHTLPQEVWDTSRLEVIRSAEHGEVYVLVNTAEHRMVAWYIPAEGYAGPDSFTVGFFSDHVAHLQTVEVEVGAPITDALADVPDATDGVVGGEPLDLTSPSVAPVLASLRGDDDAAPSPAPTPTPAPSSSVAPQPSTSPAPTTPAPSPSSPAGEHAVPEKVQTGDSAVGWLAGVAALGAVGLVLLRRRLGLAR